MDFKIGDLVKIEGQTHKLGVVVSVPIETPSGYTVKVAFKDKVFSIYTWNIAPVALKESSK